VERGWGGGSCCRRVCGCGCGKSGALNVTRGAPTHSPRVQTPLLFGALQCQCRQQILSCLTRMDALHTSTPSGLPFSAILLLSARVDGPTFFPSQASDFLDFPENDLRSFYGFTPVDARKIRKALDKFRVSA
jgi:hypothetical protein